MERAYTLQDTGNFLGGQNERAEERLTKLSGNFGFITGCLLALGLLQALLALLTPIEPLEWKARADYTVLPTMACKPSGGGHEKWSKLGLWSSPEGSRLVKRDNQPADGKVGDKLQDQAHMDEVCNDQLLAGECHVPNQPGEDIECG